MDKSPTSRFNTRQRAGDGVGEAAAGTGLDVLQGDREADAAFDREDADWYRDEQLWKQDASTGEWYRENAADFEAAERKRRERAEVREKEKEKTIQKFMNFNKFRDFSEFAK